MRNREDVNKIKSVVCSSLCCSYKIEFMSNVRSQLFVLRRAASK